MLSVASLHSTHHCYMTPYTLLLVLNLHDRPDFRTIVHQEAWQVYWTRDAFCHGSSIKQQSACCLLCMRLVQFNQSLDYADRCGMDKLQCSPETGPQTYDAPLCYQQAPCEKVCECLPADICPLVCYTGKNLVLALHRLASCTDNSLTPRPAICLGSLSCREQVIKAGDNKSRVICVIHAAIAHL